MKEKFISHVSLDEDNGSLFEKVRKSLGCEFISDIANDRYISMSKEVMKDLCFDSRSLKELSDMAQYLYGEEKKFKSKGEAIEFFIIAD